MRPIRNIFITLLATMNVIAILLLWTSAYSPHLNPASSPILACSGLAFPAFLATNLVLLIVWLAIRPRYALMPLAGMLCVILTIRVYAPINLFRNSAPAGSLKILSYNTMGFGLTEQMTQPDENPIVQYIRNSNADIVCLQEFLQPQSSYVRRIEKALPMYPYHAYYTLPGGGNAMACYARHPILRTVPIHYASDQNGSIAYYIRIGTDTLLVVNNHLESNKLTESDKKIYHDMIVKPNKTKVKEGSRLLLHKLASAGVIRAPQADAVAAFVAGSRMKHIIVCGDFNDSPLSYTHHVIGKNLTDAFVQTGCGIGHTYHRNRFYFRIDHLLMSPTLTPYRCTVDRTISTSDHYPIYANFIIKH